jgi:inorganic pyrophosphatase
MTNFAKLPTWAVKQHVYAVVETPRGSRAKLEFDPKLGAFTLAKPLLAGLTYPYDWGFIPSTRAEDGDPIDVLIIHDAATYPGLVLKCKPIGVLEVVQTSTGKKERNDRVFVVPDRSPFEGDLQDIRRLPSRAIEELEKFFEATDALESKKLEFPATSQHKRARHCGTRGAFHASNGNAEAPIGEEGPPIRDRSGAIRSPGRRKHWMN